MIEFAPSVNWVSQATRRTSWHKPKIKSGSDSCSKRTECSQHGGRHLFWLFSFMRDFLLLVPPIKHPRIIMSEKKVIHCNMHKLFQLFNVTIILPAHHTLLLLSLLIILPLPHTSEKCPQTLIWMILIIIVLVNTNFGSTARKASTMSGAADFWFSEYSTCTWLFVLYMRGAGARHEFTQDSRPSSLSTPSHK